jgi:hypothetical protein
MPPQSKTWRLAHQATRSFQGLDETMHFEAMALWKAFVRLISRKSAGALLQNACGVTLAEQILPGRFLAVVYGRLVLWLLIG